MALLKIFVAYGTRPYVTHGEGPFSMPVGGLKYNDNQYDFGAEDPQSAARFFRELAESAKTEQLRAAALRLAAEEEMHMRELERWLVRYPKPEAGWDDDPDPVNAQD